MDEKTGFHEQRARNLALELDAVTPPNFQFAETASDYMGTAAFEREIEHSKAISLKRIADALEKMLPPPFKPFPDDDIPF